MLKTDDFPTEHLQTLTKQINNWLGDMIRTGQLRMDRVTGSQSAATADSFELGEQFLMAFLDDKQIRDVNSLDRDLSDLVKPTGRRHHQLKYNKKALAYARSLVEKEETLCQLFATKLAPKIQDAIEWLDEREDEFAGATWRVRLLTVPTYHTHAFLIQQLENGSNVSTGDSYILVVSAPEWMHSRLPSQTLLRTRDFLLAFRSKVPIIGVRGTTDLSATA
jgi:hypothetical protein